VPAQHRVWNGYRVVWDVGWWLEYADADEALDACLALSSLPAFQEDVRRPRVFRVREGQAVFPLVRGGGTVSDECAEGDSGLPG
jgi:hypothetical protein